MRTVSLNIPVIGWASATAEVDDDMSDKEIAEALITGEIEIDNLKLEQWTVTAEPSPIEYDTNGYPLELEIN